MSTATKQTSWTPGPWRIGKWGAIVCDCPMACADTKSTHEFYGGHFICESVAGANADLIALAPEMAETLMEVVVWAAEAYTVKRYEPPWFAKASALVDRLPKVQL